MRDPSGECGPRSVFGRASSSTVANAGSKNGKVSVLTVTDRLAWRLLQVSARLLLRAIRHCQSLGPANPDGCFLCCAADRLGSASRFILTSMIRRARPSAVLSDDTTADAERHQVGIWRSLSSVERARLIAGASRAARTLAFAGLRERYPQASDDELVARFAVMTLGASLARRVYPKLDSILERPAGERSA
jgi:hypothetical protein